jgi:hypothetical protein
MKPTETEASESVPVGDIRGKLEFGCASGHMRCNIHDPYILFGHDFLLDVQERLALCYIRSKRSIRALQLKWWPHARDYMNLPSAAVSFEQK